MKVRIRESVKIRVLLAPLFKYLRLSTCDYDLAQYRF